MDNLKNVVVIKLEGSSKHNTLLKRCDKLIKEVEDNIHIGKTERRLQMAKLLNKCEVLLDDIQ